VERPDAWRSRDQKGFAAHGRLAPAVLAQPGFLARRRQCLRAVAWSQHVEQNEGEECSAEPAANRLGSDRPGRADGQRDRFRPPELPLGWPDHRRANWAPDSRLSTTYASLYGRPITRQPLRDGSYEYVPEFPQAARVALIDFGAGHPRHGATRSQRSATRPAGFWTPHRAGRAREMIL
jgi:hypothetical protein